MTSPSYLDETLHQMGYVHISKVEWLIRLKATEIAREVASRMTERAAS